MRFDKAWMTRAAAVLLGLGLGLGLAGCDPQRISELEEGVSTEADVRARFGAPEAVWDGPQGARVLEYNRNPAGHQNYMITIGPDGRMSALRQVLHPANFDKVKPGMSMEEVRRMLGKPAEQQRYPNGEASWAWRWMDPPTHSMFFVAWFDSDWRVKRTGIEKDPHAEQGVAK
jgi:hypothetical protein